jgi:hypothetical protein
MKKSTTSWLSDKSLFHHQVDGYPGKINFLGFTIVLLSFFLLSCNKEAADVSGSKTSGTRLKETTTSCAATLIAGQYYNAGSVTTAYNNDMNQMTITYSTVNSGFCLTETHLDVQINPANFPQTPTGNPKVGQFAYGATLGCVTEWTQVIDLNTVPGWTFGSRVFIAAHAVVKGANNQKETAWGQGKHFPGNNWAMYFYCDPNIIN